MKNQRIPKIMYIIFCTILAIVGLAFTLHYGLKGQPVRKIKLSHFENSEQIASSVLLILRKEFQSQSVVFLGVEPDLMGHMEIAEKIQQLAQKDPDQNMHFTEVLIEPKLSRFSFFGSAVPIDIKFEAENLVQKIQTASQNNGKILVIVPTIYATQLIKEAPVSQLKISSGLSMMSISMVPLFVGNDELKSWNVPCFRDGDQSGESPLGCAVRDRAVVIGYYKVKKDKIAGTLEQFGAEDYLLFLHYPTATAVVK